MLGPINIDISKIVWRYEWQSKIEMVNIEFCEKCSFSDDDEYDENGDIANECALYYRRDHGNGVYDFDWNIYNYRCLGSGMLSLEDKPEIYNSEGECVCILPKNYEFTATTLLRSLRKEFRSASLSLSSKKRQKVEKGYYKC